jgi:hypothetical protein
METINTQALREALAPGNSAFFDQPNHIIGELMAKYQDWNSNPDLTFAERQLGAQIYNEAIQGL